MALSADLAVDRKESGLQSFPVYQSTTIYKGAIVHINSSGYLVPASDTSGEVCVGIAYEQCNNSSGASGAKSCRVYTEGVFKLVTSGASQATVGVAMYSSNDTLVVGAGSVTNDILVGVCVEYVSATSIWVDISRRVS